MKRTYVSPLVNSIEIENEEIIATSPNINIGIDKENGGTEQLGNKQQGKWGDVWGKWYKTHNLKGLR